MFCEETFLWGVRQPKTFGGAAFLAGGKAAKQSPQKKREVSAETSNVAPFFLCLHMPLE